MISWKGVLKCDACHILMVAQPTLESGDSVQNPAGERITSFTPAAWIL